MRKNLYETLLYLIFGVLTSLVSYISFYVCYQVLFEGTWPLVANTISFVLATTFAFLTNKRFVFKSPDWSWGVLFPELVSFFAARLFSFFIEQAGLALAQAALDPSHIVLLLGPYPINGVSLAKIGLSFLAVVLNYFFAKFLIFKKKDQEVDQ